MTTGFFGTYVISWAQTELDGLAEAGPEALAVGATWRWRGEAVRVDGPGDLLVLGHSEEVLRLRQRAAGVVRRIVPTAVQETGAREIPAPEDPVLSLGFSVTDGVQSYTASIVEEENRPPLLVFMDQTPPEDIDLWVTQVAEDTLRTHRSGDAAPQVICFTPETRIATPEGSRAVGELTAGAQVLTKDDGPQPIRWIGAREITGARLMAMPELRPVRIRSGALGEERPDGDLLVSAGHRVLVKEKMAQALFGTDEVLVAARDLINDHSIIRDRQVRRITYIHFLMDRHQIVFANGVESETFHPGSMPIEAVAAEHRTGLKECLADQDGASYGPYARRPLTCAETAILRYGRHALNSEALHGL